jgi:hypothetical protein
LIEQDLERQRKQEHRKLLEHEVKMDLARKRAEKKAQEAKN